jgi:hypothetical protein
MLGIIALVAAPIAGLLGYAATRPDSFRIERSATIAAPPERILPFIEDFHRWEGWSPFEKLDPQMNKSFAGAQSGRGAVYTWEGKKSGIGRMEITDLSQQRVVIKLDFEKPFKASNIAEFILQPAGGSTHVTWAMHGSQPFINKLMGVFINLDKLVGKDFDTGLAGLKALAER